MCVGGVCQSSPLAPVSECPFGDDFVYNNTFGVKLDKPLISCQDFLKSLASINASPEAFCLSNAGRMLCCQTCLSITHKNSI